MESKSPTRNIRSRLTEQLSNTWCGMFLLHWPALMVVREYTVQLAKADHTLSVAVHPEIMYVSLYIIYIYLYAHVFFFKSQL